jgi:hypothetical protein
MGLSQSDVGRMVEEEVLFEVNDDDQNENNSYQTA